MAPPLVEATDEMLEAIDEGTRSAQRKDLHNK